MKMIFKRGTHKTVDRNFSILTLHVIFCQLPFTFQWTPTMLTFGVSFVVQKSSQTVQRVFFEEVKKAYSHFEVNNCYKSLFLICNHFVLFLAQIKLSFQCSALNWFSEKYRNALSRLIISPRGSLYHNL